MITVSSEVTMWGTVQHCEVKHYALAICLYEQAMKFGLEPDMSQLHGGGYLVEFYADDDTYTMVYRAAQDEADREMMHEMEVRRSLKRAA